LAALIARDQETLLVGWNRRVTANLILFTDDDFVWRVDNQFFQRALLKHHTLLSLVGELGPLENLGEASQVLVSVHLIFKPVQNEKARGLL